MCLGPHKINIFEAIFAKFKRTKIIGRAHSKSGGLLVGRGVVGAAKGAHQLLMFGHVLEGIAEILSRSLALLRYSKQLSVVNRARPD